MAPGRARARYRDHSRNGPAHAARLRDRQRGHDARCIRLGAPPCDVPDRIRPQAGGSAADGRCAGGPGARSRGSDGARASPRAHVRCARRFKRPRTRADRDACPRNTGSASGRDGGAGVDGGDGRQWVHRRNAAAALLSRSAGQFDLGRLRQRDLSRCAACSAARAVGPGRALGRGRAGARRPSRSRPQRRSPAPRGSAKTTRTRRPRVTLRRRLQSCFRRRCWCGMHLRRSAMRIARRGLRGDAAFAGGVFGGHGIAFDPSLPLRRARGDPPPEPAAGT